MRYFIVFYQADLPERIISGSVSFSSDRYVNRLNVKTSILSHINNPALGISCALEDIVVSNILELSKEDYTEWTRVDLT